jgi:hypothetical protein
MHNVGNLYRSGLTSLVDAAKHRNSPPPDLPPGDRWPTSATNHTTDSRRGAFLGLLDEAKRKSAGRGTTTNETATTVPAWKIDRIVATEKTVAAEGSSKGPKG